MIRIIAIDAGRADGVSFWRNLRPLTELQRTYPNVQIKFMDEKVPLHELMQTDLVIMFRPVRPESLKFIENVKNHLFNTKLIVDIDDNLWRLPPGHPHEIDYAEHAQGLRKIYSMADGIWCSTEAIMPFADAMDGRGVVVPNAVLGRDLPDKPSPYKGVVMWRGSLANFDDIESDLAFEQFLENQPKFARWFFMGYYPKRLRAINTKGLPHVDVVKYMSGLREIGLNVMWKPLQDNEFNASKSNIAWIESVLAGGICVTNFSGRAGWEMAVDKFTDNPDFIAHQWALSRDWILEHYNLKKVNEIRYQHILKTLES